MHSTPIRSLAIGLTLGFLALARPASAVWLQDGTPVAAEPNTQSEHAVYPDAAGGMFVVWTDARGGTNDIYAQRVDAHGNSLWVPGGMAVCVLPNAQSQPQVTTDGAGGIIIVWTDQRSGSSLDIYGQRITPMGAALWGANGALVNDNWSIQQDPVVVPDGASGAWVLWRDFRDELFTANIYLQRMTSGGLRWYALDGEYVALYCGEDDALTAISDGSGGFYAAFVNHCNFIGEILIVHVTGGGAYAFTPIPPYSGFGCCNNLQPSLASNASGDVIVAWTSDRYGAYDIFAQRMNGSGTRLWGWDGILVCGQPNDQVVPRIAADGAGGALIAWADLRTGFSTDVFAQHVGVAGNPLWTFDGAGVCSEGAGQQPTSIFSDGAGGAVVLWEDYRTGFADGYAQRMDETGLPRWTVNGVGVATRNLNQNGINGVRASDGAVLTAWSDGRTGDLDLYAQRLELKHGTWGHPEPAVVSVLDNPSDQGGRVVVRWNASGRDVPNQATITHYSIWRAADEAVAAAAQTIGVAGLASGPDAVRADSPAGLVWRDETMTSNEYWEHVGTQIATYGDRYSFNMETRHDSVASDPAIHSVRVVAHTSNAFVFYTSNVGTGFSVDNLAPEAPLQLFAQRISPTDVRLHWRRSHEADLKWYAVYRATSAGVGTTPLFFLSNAIDTLEVDDNAPAGPSYYYVVTAWDVHDNQSAPSNEVNVGGSTGVGNTPAMPVLSLLPAYPNPSSGRVSLQVGLRSASRIEVEVYDVAGRRVHSLSRSGAAGWQSIDFEPRDNKGALLVSGVYFYRVRAAGLAETSRFVIRR